MSSDLLPWGIESEYIYSVTNPGYMKDNFEIQLLTWHKPGAGQIENVHNLEPKKWKDVEVITIDIATDKKQISTNDYKEHEDPRYA